MEELYESVQTLTELYPVSSVQSLCGVREFTAGRDDDDDARPVLFSACLYISFHSLVAKLFNCNAYHSSTSNCELLKNRFYVFMRHLCEPCLARMYRVVLSCVPALFGVVVGQLGRAPGSQDECSAPLVCEVKKQTSGIIIFLR